MQIYKQIILNKLLKYLELRKWKIKKSGKVIMVLCPYCKKEPFSANIIPNTSVINCFTCGKKYTLLDVAQKIEENFPKDEEEQLKYLKDLLKVDVMTSKDEEEILKVLNFYEKNGFDLVPVAKNAKNPIEKDWTNKTHKNKDEWFNWVQNSLNLGIKTGIKSNITVLDIDTNEIPKELLLLLNTTLLQKTNKGWHYIYKYEKDLPKTRINELEIDIENDGGQIVCEPSIVEDNKRTMILRPVAQMSKELKEFIKSKILMPSKTQSEKLREEINTEEFKINPEDFKLKNNNLEGCCNSSFIKLGGILRKQLNIQQTEFVLSVLNKHILEQPMTYQAIKGMIRELEKYVVIDEEDLMMKVLEYLKIVDSPRSVNDISNTVVGTNRGEDKKRIEKVLNYLLKEERIIKKGRTSYEIIKEMEWTDTILDVGVPVDFKVPYFHDYAYFYDGDLIIIGSKNKFGKTTLAVNILKRLIEQGLKPCYIYNEGGGRFAKVSLKLGLKDGDYFKVSCYDPNQVILKPNTVTIYDWVKPAENDYTQLSEIFSRFVYQLEKKKGFMICFVQLRTESDRFFAPDQIGQFPAFLAKYLYRDKEGLETTFQIDNVRDPKMRNKTFNIDCAYNWETKEVKRLDELEENKPDGTESNTE